MALFAYYRANAFKSLLERLDDSCQTLREIGTARVRVI